LTSTASVPFASESLGGRAGLAWKFFDHWLLRGEWLHDDFGSVAIADDLFTAPFGFNGQEHGRRRPGRSEL